MLRPCIDCGTPADGSHCDDHQPRRHRDRGTARQRGYSRRWDELSRRARRLQPFCTDCGATEDLTADHLPSAWERHEQRLPIRLTDVEVVCGDCNSRRGSSRPGTDRAARLLDTRGETPHEQARDPRGKAKFESYPSGVSR